MSGRIVYCPERSAWLEWTGTHYDECADDAPAHQLVDRVVDLLPKGDAEADKGTLERSQAAFRIKYCATTAAESIVRKLRKLDEMRVSVHRFDSHPYELNTPDGIVHLARQGATVMEHDPTKLHTKITGKGVDQRGATPTWNTFLATTYEGDRELIAFMHRLMGMTIIGKVTEELIVFLFGPTGGNGKSVLMEVLTALLGTYAIQAPGKFLVAGRDRHETEIARLKGARLVSCSELNSTDKFDEAKAKLLSGGDRLTGRGMRENFADFVPSHTLWQMANNRPEVDTGGYSFFRRLKVIRHDHTVAEGDRVQGLATTMVKDEGAAILWRIVQGAVDYLRDGLQVPASVGDATGEYRIDTRGPVEKFLDDMCDITRETTTTAGSAYSCYMIWARQHGEDFLSQKAFGMRLGDRVKGRMTKGRKEYYMRVAVERFPANENRADVD